MEDKPEKLPDPLAFLKQFTAARIAIGRVGVSIPVQQSLAFKLAHAHARDAVYSKLHSEEIAANLADGNLPVLTVHSKAADRHNYLQRPDLGRKLSESSLAQLSGYAANYDVVIIIADGLSAEAVNANGVLLVKLLISHLKKSGLTIGPLVLASQGRVALGDEIAYALNAKLSVILIGERPGLSAADSIGAYLTYNSRPGLTDDSRNCISNIRPGGLSFDLAAEKICFLIQEAFRIKLSGVGLKDTMQLPLNLPR